MKVFLISNPWSTKSILLKFYIRRFYAVSQLLIMLKNYVSTHSFVKTNDLFICICKYDIKRRGNGSTIAPPKQQNCRDKISHIMVNTFMPFLRNTFCMFMALWDHRQYVDFGLKIEFRSCARRRRWCSILHNNWWTASNKPRLLFIPYQIWFRKTVLSFRLINIKT